MSAYKIIVDSEKCIGCGLCKEDCVAFDIEVTDGKAQPKGVACIGCGHCEAICPKGAVTLTGVEDTVEEFEEQVRLDPDRLMAAIRTRRTIRKFTKQEVPQETVDLIIEAGRLAPTGGNGQGTRYVILKDKKAECEAIAVNIFRTGTGLGKGLISFLKSMTIDDHFFFKGAPLVIVLCSNDTVSASLAAENMAFMAEACGLGVLYSGFFTACVNLSSKIRKLMGVGRRPKAVTTMVIGYPAVKYHRTARRKPADVIKA